MRRVLVYYDDGDFVDVEYGNVYDVLSPNICTIFKLDYSIVTGGEIFPAYVIEFYK